MAWLGNHVFTFLALAIMRSPGAIGVRRSFEMITTINLI